MKSLALSFLLVASAGAQSAPLSPEGFLLKVSQRLTGARPKMSEYAALEDHMRKSNCRKVDCLTEYLAESSKGKMETPAFYSESILKVTEHFGLQTPGTLPFPLQTQSMSDTSKGFENLLIYRTVKKNLSVDELFTGQLVWQFDMSKVLENSLQADFFGQKIESENEVKPSPLLGEVDGQSEDFKFAQLDYTGHPNVAGLLSSPKFLNRYWNTPVNGNRKRAAAVFKIMLCDPMNPALERAGQNKRENDLAQGVTESVSTERSFEEIHRNRHANQKDCAQCHNRLDPLARTMRPLELGISKFASPGRLRFLRRLDRPVDQPAANFQDIVRLMTKHQKYADCQMNWLFNWIVGKDVKVHPQRFADMMGDFEQDGRKIKTTIEKLLLSPEFRGEAQAFATAPSFEKAKTVFSNCTDCHRAGFFNVHGSQFKMNLSKIAYKLDLANDGKSRIMPPDYHYWQPDAADIKAIKDWYQEGAPLSPGHGSLTQTEVNQLLQPKGKTK